MRCALAFSSSMNGQFLVTLEVQAGSSNTPQPSYTTTAFENENCFIERVVLGEVGDGATRDIIAGVLLSVADRLPPSTWTIVDLSCGELFAIGLRHVEGPTGSDFQDVKLGSDADLNEVLLQAPIALALLTGPHHHIAFINASYTSLLGRKRRECLLGKDVRQALTEPGNKPFVRFLDEVYTTGKPHVGTEFRAELYNEESDSIEESFFDFIFHPLRDTEGVVYGILCLATDVTDRVLSKLVSESRESKLYRQWSELSTIYDKSPLGLCLFDPQALRIDRINDEFARFVGVDRQSAKHQTSSDLFARTPKMKTLLGWAADGQHIDDYEFSFSEDGENRIWRLNINPIVDSFGKVEGILASALNVGGQSRRLQLEASGTLQEGVS